MYFRRLLLVVLSVFCLGVATRPIPNRTPEQHVSLPPNCAPNFARIDARCAARFSEQDIINHLASPETEIEEFTPLLEALGHFNQSERVVAVLIRWLDYADWGNRRLPQREFIPPTHPAAEALKRIGLFAVPQLVAEYVQCFENSSLDPAGRIIVSKVRCSSISDILSESPTVGSAAIECAWHRLVAATEDDHVQRAARLLITDVVIWYCQKHEKRPYLTPEVPIMVSLPGMAADRVVLIPLLKDRLPVPDRARLIADLHSFRDSPIIVASLIEWVEFRPSTNAQVQIGEHCDWPHPIEEYPAAVALTKTGVFAAPRLVGEYLCFFENTDHDINRDRQFVRVSSDEKRGVHDEQSPAHRLSLIVMVLSHNDKMAQAAVRNTLARMAAAQQDARLQRAGLALIKEIVCQFPAERQAELFPASICRVNAPPLALCCYDTVETVHNPGRVRDPRRPRARFLNTRPSDSLTASPISLPRRHRPHLSCNF